MDREPKNPHAHVTPPARKKQKSTSSIFPSALRDRPGHSVDRLDPNVDDELRRQSFDTPNLTSSADFSFLDSSKATKTQRDYGISEPVFFTVEEGTKRISSSHTPTFDLARAVTERRVLLLTALMRRSHVNSEAKVLSLVKEKLCQALAQYSGIGLALILTPLEPIMRESQRSKGRPEEGIKVAEAFLVYKDHDAASAACAVLATSYGSASKTNNPYPTYGISTGVSAKTYPLPGSDVRVTFSFRGFANTTDLSSVRTASRSLRSHSHNVGEMRERAFQAGIHNTRTDNQIQAHDNVRSARPAAASHQTNPDSGNVRLRDVSEEAQSLQRRYFNTTDPDALVRCLTCGKLGHEGDKCPSLTCEHCGEFDRHTSAACPKYRKCERCRQRGHDARDCRSFSVIGGGPNDPCDVCGNHGHVEEECADLWRTYFPKDDEVAKIPAAQMRRGCYKCGSSAHFGDDCPQLDAAARRRNARTKGSYSVWSAEYASKFIEKDEPPMEDDLDEGKGGSGSTQAYQLAMLDDMRD